MSRSISRDWMWRRIQPASGKKSKNLPRTRMKTPNGREVPCGDRELPVAKRVGTRGHTGAHIDSLDLELELDRIFVVWKHFHGIRVRRACDRVESLPCHQDVVECKRQLQLLCFQQNLVMQSTRDDVAAEGDELLRLVFELIVPGGSHSHARRR